MSDPLVNQFSKFPLSEPDGHVWPAEEGPSRSATRPFGLRYAMPQRGPVATETKHEKPRTRERKTRQTKRDRDGKDGRKVESDTEEYVQYD